jgi:hypothetical protein
VFTLRRSPSLKSSSDVKVRVQPAEGLATWEYTFPVPHKAKSKQTRNAWKEVDMRQLFVAA